MTNTNNFEVTKFTPKQLAATKSVEQARSAKIAQKAYAIWQERVRMAKELHAAQVPLEVIARTVQDSLDETQEMIDLSPDNYRKPFWITT